MKFLSPCSAPAGARSGDMGKYLLTLPGLPGVTQSQARATKALSIVVGERKVTFRLKSISLSQGKIYDIKGA